MNRVSEGGVVGGSILRWYAGASGSRAGLGAEMSIRSSRPPNSWPLKERACFACSGVENST